jgi:UDP:flavonoid glycosyltransferase YjiC (YdhE family)
MVATRQLSFPRVRYVGRQPKPSLSDAFVCAVPFGRDQQEVARRVEVAGAGTRLPARRLSAKHLREKIKQAMERTPGAQQIAAAFAAAGGPTRAADALQHRLLRPASITLS